MDIRKDWRAIPVSEEAVSSGIRQMVQKIGLESEAVRARARPLLDVLEQGPRGPNAMIGEHPYCLGDLLILCRRASAVLLGGSEEEMGLRVLLEVSVFSQVPGWILHLFVPAVVGQTVDEEELRDPEKTISIIPVLLEGPGENLVN